MRIKARAWGTELAAPAVVAGTLVLVNAAERRLSNRAELRAG